MSKASLVYSTETQSLPHPIPTHRYTTPPTALTFMTPQYEQPDPPELAATIVNEESRDPIYTLYPSHATDEELHTQWIRFRESDSVSLSEAL